MRMRLPALAIALAAALAAGAPPAAAEPSYSLRADADGAGILLGSALQVRAMEDPDYAALLRRHVNTITWEDAVKFGPVHPERDRYDFERADAIARFARRNGMTMRGHVLLWHVQNPEWISGGDFSRAEATGIMRRHIRRVVGHFQRRFPGLVTHWDVVNEGIDNDGTRRMNPWQRWIGEDYLDIAFRAARRAAGPDVKLFYNDYFDNTMVFGAEFLTGGQFDDGDTVPAAAPGATGALPCEALVKCREVRELVEGMLARGVPIDGVGFQAHIPNPEPSDYRGLTAWVGELGLEWAATELDVPVPNDSGPEGRAHQADAYELVATACLEDPACDTVVSWDISDRYTWWQDLMDGALSDALHFDADLEPKLAADRLHEVLAAARIHEGPCDRRLRGTEEANRLEGSWVGDSIRARGRGDRVRARRGADCIYGQRGTDRLRDGPGDDRVYGGPGRDRLRGGAGRDLLQGGRGHDVIDARDGAADRVRCGPGRDRARIDARDRVKGCERVATRSAARG